MPNMLFTNNAATILASGISSSATSLTVTAGTGALFPTLGAGQYFYVTLANLSGTREIVKCTARSTDTLTVTRAQDGTTAVAWNSGDKVELRLVRADLLNFGQLDSTNTWDVAQTFTASPTITALNPNLPVFTNGSDTLTNTGVSPIANGGTNNGSLAVTAGGVVYTDGTKQMNTGAGTSGQFLVSAGASPPTWTTVTGSGLDVQTFNASGTWTKPAAAPSTATVLIEVISGGGSGGSRNITSGTQVGGGGGGGAYLSRIISIASLGATETVTVGAGGTAISVASTAGNTGGTSSFGSWLSALGGGGGGTSGGLSGGTGGGAASAATSNANGGNGSIGGGGGGGIASPLGVGGTGISNGINATSSSGGSGGIGLYGGGGGGGASNGNVAGAGGNTTYGGGGGGGATGTTSGSGGAGGTSQLGGNGGAGGIQSSASNGGDGVAPGGGGGGVCFISPNRSGAGATGRVTITTIW